MESHTRLFSERAAIYVKHRPTYPPELIQYIQQHTRLTAGATAADIGAGTGIFSALIAEKVQQLYCIEPNDAMRQQCQQYLSSYHNCHIIAGTAETTGLPDGSIDVISVAQAFHWFDIPRALQEFRRIAKPDAQLLLIWNDRAKDTPFMQQYEQAIETFALDYQRLGYKKHFDETALTHCFSNNRQKITFRHAQYLSFTELMGRLQSSSYAPVAGTDAYRQLSDFLQQVFSRHAVNNFVKFEYDAVLYWGKL